MVAGQEYDVVMQYFDDTRDAVTRLHWSSPSLADKAIEPATQVGVNWDAGYAGDACFANLVNGGSRNVWWRGQH